MQLIHINLICLAVSAYLAGRFSDSPGATAINLLAAVINLVIVAVKLAAPSLGA